MTDARIDPAQTPPPAPTGLRSLLVSRAPMLGHFIAVFVLTMKGVSKLEHHHPFVAAGCWLTATVILLATSFHRRLAHRIHHIEAFICYLDTLVLGGVAWVVFADGKKAQACVWLASSALTLIAAIVLHRSASRGHAAEAGVH